MRTAPFATPLTLAVLPAGAAPVVLDRGPPLETKPGGWRAPRTLRRQGTVRPYANAE
jgi:hypothetical protein